MKKILTIMLILMCIGITGCTASNVEEAETQKPFEKVYQDNHVTIYVDTETSVMYVSNNGHGGTALIVMVDEFGKPRLYKENEHEGE